MRGVTWFEILATRIMGAVSFLVYFSYSSPSLFLFLAIHLRAHFQSCTNRWLTHALF